MITVTVTDTLANGPIVTSQHINVSDQRARHLACPQCRPATMSQYKLSK